MNHMMYLAEDAPERFQEGLTSFEETVPYLWILCESPNKEYEAKRIVDEGRDDNLIPVGTYVDCPECRKLVIDAGGYGG